MLIKIHIRREQQTNAWKEDCGEARKSSDGEGCAEDLADSDKLLSDSVLLWSLPLSRLGWTAETINFEIDWNLKNSCNNRH